MRLKNSPAAVQCSATTLVAKSGLHRFHVAMNAYHRFVPNQIIDATPLADSGAGIII